MTAHPMLKRSVLTLGALGAVALLYRLRVRGRILNWGATAAEAEARLPGDELLENADGVATRGGAYTYDWIENLLGLDMHSTDQVLPEYQHPQVGDTVGYGKNRMHVERAERERVLATRSEDGNWVWNLVLDERDGATRLISRNRFRLPTLTAKVGMAPMEPASLVMERKMLQGIKRRAERLIPEEKGKSHA